MLRYFTLVILLLQATSALAIDGEGSRLRGRGNVVVPLRAKGPVTESRRDVAPPLTLDGPTRAHLEVIWKQGSPELQAAARLHLRAEDARHRLGIPADLDPNREQAPRRPSESDLQKVTALSGSALRKLIHVRNAFVSAGMPEGQVQALKSALDMLWWERGGHAGDLAAEIRAATLGARSEGFLRAGELLHYLWGLQREHEHILSHETIVDERARSVLSGKRGAGDPLLEAIDDAEFAARWYREAIRDAAAVLAKSMPSAPGPHIVQGRENAKWVLQLAAADNGRKVGLTGATDSTDIELVNIAKQTLAQHKGD